MLNRKLARLALTSIVAGAPFALADDHGAATDFGAWVEHQIEASSIGLFGVVRGLDSSSSESVGQAQADANALSLVTLANGLRARVITASPSAGANIDMMGLWPAQNPTHIVACNEQGTSEPAVQRIRLSDGAVETILTGMSSCDPVRVTVWDTVIVGEEAGSSGWLLEIQKPLQTTGVQFDRSTGALSGNDAVNVATRPAVGHLSFEGIALYPNGVMYYGDENRPSQGTAGGAYFKFVPTMPYDGNGQGLAASPLVDGQVYGLRLGLRSGATDYGPGSNSGKGAWVEISNSNGANLRAAAASLKLTGYYRPEDLDVDSAALADGAVRFCGNNTGNESDDSNWGETVCITDGTLSDATANQAVPELQLLVVGDPELAMPDNIAYQPGRGNWIVHEDGDGPEVGRNNDLWSCLDDGADLNATSDGCLRIATLNDLNAEWTGGFFDASGRHFYVSVQHNVTGHGVVLDITGWR
jgi:Alkaline phosphatase PhoX